MKCLLNERNGRGSVILLSILQIICLHFPMKLEDHVDDPTSKVIPRWQKYEGGSDE